MPVNVTTWEQGYWDGTDPAGYSRLPEKIFRVANYLSHPSQGELWLDRAYGLLQSQPMQNSTVLEIGCGNGQMTEALFDRRTDGSDNLQQKPVRLCI